MSPTRIDPDPRELAPIEEALFQARAGLEVTRSSVSRLLETAFSNAPLANQRLTHIARRHRVETAIAVLEDRHLYMGLMNVGFLRGSLFQPGTRRAAKAAIAELVIKLREADKLGKTVKDLERARHRLLDRADQARLQEQARDRPRPRDRGRKRSDF